MKDHVNRRGLNSPITPEEILPLDLMPKDATPARQSRIRSALLLAIRQHIGLRENKKQIIALARQILKEDGVQ